ncbi:unnamed protein product [Moneuplotes crassus]|uniref:Uncharacterized protein n=1 Tax=Euplotes crassus TaxID=5936 RepID=A0AAD1UMR8_EUPCR|nr:unnamed protein product [Moneuplotes crassus]
MKTRRELSKDSTSIKKARNTTSDICFWVFNTSSQCYWRSQKPSSAPKISNNNFRVRKKLVAYIKS